MRRTILLAAAVVAGAAVVPPPVDAADGVPVIVAGPGAARGAGYATRIVAVQPGDRPTLVNTDIAWHDLVAEETGPDDQPWCEPVDPSKPENPVSNPRRYPIGECPLFWTDFTTGLGGQRVVQGLDALESGRVYEFRCTVTSGMTGNFFVL